MGTRNAEMAEMFHFVGHAMLYEGEPWVKAGSYLKFAALLRELDEAIEDIAARHKLRDLPGVGKAIDTKATEWLDTGTFPLLDRLRAAVPPGAQELLEDGLGPATVHHLEERGIGSLAELRAAVGRDDDALGKLPKKAREDLAAWRAS